MRVLHLVATDQRRGAEVFASDLMSALSELDVEQRLAVLRPGASAGVRAGTEATPLGSDGWMLPGLRVYPRTLRALSRLMTDWPPDVVQAHGGEPLKYAALARGARGAAIVYRRIGTAPPWIRRGVRRIAHGRLMRRADRVVTVADAVRRETVERFGVPPSRVVTIPNGVDGRRIRPSTGRPEIRRRLGIPPRAPVILSLGALTWEKDPFAQLEVMAGVRVPGALLLMVGDGPLRAEVEAAIPQRGLTGRVRLLGSMDGVADVLAASDALLFTSRTGGMEGMPASVIEAGMLGCPVVAYAVAGVPEVVEDDVTGVLVPPGNPGMLADRLSALLQDDAVRRAMGRAATDRCVPTFEIQTIAPRYLSLYEQVASERDTAGSVAR